MGRQKVHLALPKAEVVEGYVDSSRTPVPLMLGFQENVVFVPWEDFEEWVGKADSSIKEMDESVKEKVEAKLDEARDELSGEEGSSEKHRYTNCKSMASVTQNVFTALQNMVGNIKGRKLYVKCLNFSAKVLNDLLLPKARGGLKWSKVEPDFSLSKHFEVHTKPFYRPYATFEFKGPCRILYKWRSDYDVDDLDISRASDGADQTSSHQSGPGPIDSQHNGQILGLDSAEMLAKFCNAAFRGVDEDLLSDCELEYCGDSRDVGVELTDTPVKPTQLLITPIAQTLTQGMISSSGCCMLYNHQHAIAFKVCGMDAVYKTKVRVMVSRQFHSDKQKGTVMAMLALMLHSLKLCVRSKDRKDLREELKIALKHIHDAALRRKAKLHIKRPADNTGDDEKDKKRQKTEENAAQRHFSTHDSSDDHSQTTICTGTGSDSSLMNKEKGTQEWHHMESGMDIGSVISNSKEIRQGFSGIIRLGEHKGEKLIIKLWNLEEEDGLEEVENELKVYRSLSGKKHNVQGRAMPVLKGFFDSSSSNPVIVIEHVGRPIREDEDGRLVIGEKKNLRTLALEEVRALRQAALDSLRSIHAAGFIHGDIALRNLRVDYKNGADTSQSTSWRACWIDYGRASRSCATAYYKAFEIEGCRSLFPHAVRT